MKKPVEEWRDVVGYEGLYQVSNRGRVRSYDRTVPHGVGKRVVRHRIMKQYINDCGYCQVRLNKNHVSKNKRVHRLVAEAFISNPRHLKQVNHIDLDKTNNHVENLEWCSQKKNLIHAVNNNAIQSYAILQCDEKGRVLNEWVSLGRLCDKLLISHTTISRACKGENGKRKHEAYGYYWYYKDENFVKKYRKSRGFKG